MTAYRRAILPTGGCHRAPLTRWAQHASSDIMTVHPKRFPSTPPIRPNSIAYYRRNTETAYSRQRGPRRSRRVLDSDEKLCICVADASGPQRPTPSTRRTTDGAHSNRNLFEASVGALEPSQCHAKVLNTLPRRPAHVGRRCTEPSKNDKTVHPSTQAAVRSNKLVGGMKDLWQPSNVAVGALWPSGTYLSGSAAGRSRQRFVGNIFRSFSRSEACYTPFEQAR